MGIIISVEDFRSRIEKGKGTVHDEVTVEHRVIIKQDEFNVPFFSFQHVNFRKGLLFDEIGSVGKGIKLRNCEGSILFISGCEVTEFGDDFELPNGSGLLLDQCNFKHVQIIDNPKFDRGISVKNETKINHLEIIGSDFDFASISLDKVSIGTCDIENVALKSDLGFSIDHSIVESKVRIFDLRAGSISLLRSQFKSEVFIEKCTAGISLNTSTFENTIRITNNEIASFNSFEDHFMRGFELTIESKDDKPIGSLKSITLLSTEIKRGFIVNGSHSHIDKVEITCDDQLSGRISFNSFTIKNLFLQGTNRHVEFDFNLCTIHYFRLQNFNNQNTFRLTQCESSPVDSKVQFSHSWLGKFLLFNSNFKDAQTIEIYDSHIAEMDVIGKEWFTDNQLFRHSKTDNTVHIIATPNLDSKLFDNARKKALIQESRRKRDIYRQLKLASERNGDRIQALEYKARELVHYQTELQLSKNRLQKDRLILWMSSSNDMGLHWGKPLLFLILLTIPFFIFTVASHNSELFWVNPIDFCSIHWGNTWLAYSNYWGYLWSMFNPVRNLKDVMSPEIGKLSGLVYFWDGLHRILLAFFIFQIVSAFRKYIK